MVTWCIVVVDYRWDYRDVHYLDSMKLLYTLKLEGKIKELGLTNFDTLHMAKLYEECAIPIVSNQVKFHLSSALYGYFYPCSCFDTLCTLLSPKARKILSLNLSASFGSLKADHKALAFLGFGQF